MHKPTLELTLRRRPDKSVYIEVRVRSLVRPRLSRLGISEFDNLKGRFHVEVLAGAIAEELCIKYNDRLDPDEVAKAAGKAYDELMRHNPSLKLGTELPRDAC